MAISTAKLRAFQKTVWSHYRREGRSFPWRAKVGSYRIFVSEIMLQQTQTQRVEEKYREFIRKFPSWQTLAAARLEHIYEVWKGLGYNRRALALRNAAQEITGRWKGRLPSSPDHLESLPGVGRYTARAIGAFAFNRPEVVLETNIRAAVIYHFFRRKKHVSDAAIEEVLARAVSRTNAREWYWALMDYGVMIKGRYPEITARSAHYRKQSAFRGSIREARGAILRVVSHRGFATLDTVVKEFKVPRERLVIALQGLTKDGLVSVSRKRIILCR